MNKVFAMTIPRFGFVRMARALPNDVCKNNKAIAIVGPQLSDVFVQFGAQPTIQANADSDVIPIHEFDKIG